MTFNNGIQTESTHRINSHHIITVIFSKDRPLQLAAVLESFILNCTDFENCNVSIIYKCSNNCFSNLYIRLKEEYSSYTNITFIKEGVFKNDVLDLLSKYKHVLWLVDDNFIIRNFSLNYLTQLLDEDNDSIGVSLRLGKNTTYCYPIDKPQKLPEFTELSNGLLKYNWTLSDHDFGYPLELSSSIYRTADLYPLMSLIEFKNPNTLESQIDSKKNIFSSKYPGLICPTISYAFCNPANLVQNQYTSNRNSNLPKYSAKILADKFEAGQRIDINKYQNMVPNACHQEVVLYFKNSLSKPRKFANCSNTSDSKANQKTIRFENQDRPIVTIAIPTYKRPSYLQKAIQSALEQDNCPSNYEILVISDGFHPATEAVVSEFDSKRLRFIQKEHFGVANSRNVAIDKAHGDYILWLDDDDLLEPNTLETHLSILSKHPDADVIYGKLHYFNDGTGDFLKYFDPKDWYANSHMLLSSLSMCCCIPNPGTLVKKSAYKETGSYNEYFQRAEDYEFWTRAASKLNFKKNNNVVCRYRIHTNNMSFDRSIDFSYESLIIRNMVSRYGLKRLFNYLDWSKSCAADAVSKYLISKSLYACGDYFNCFEILSQIKRDFWSKDIAKLALNCSLITGKAFNADLDIFSKNIQAHDIASKFNQLSKKIEKALHSRNADECLQILNDYQSIGLAPTADLLLKFGILLKDSGSLADSKIFFKRAEMINPHIFHNNKNILKQFDIEDKEEIFSTRNRILNSYPIPQRREIIQHQPTDSIETDNVTSLQIATRHYESENFQTSIDTLNHIIALNPSNWDSYPLIVDVMLQSGQEALIPEKLHQLEGRSDLPADILALIGSGYEASGNIQKAAVFCDQALTVGPESARAWNLKGVIAYRNGHESETSQSFQKASEYDENWGDPWTNMGTLHWEHGNQDKALQCFEAGFQLSPTSPNVATSYHIAVSKTGQYERAREVFESVVSHHPDFRKGRLLLIDVLIRLKAYQAALDQIEAILVRFRTDLQFLEAAKTVRAKVGPLAIDKGKHPSLSLCMIVKNEEKYLARCLASLKSIVDEMIIVDTGSTDTTRDIAEVFGAKVFDFEWNSDFADARNHSLEKASGDWILVMDADEVIAASDHGNLLDLLKKSNNDKQAYVLTTRNYTDRQDSADYSENTGQYKEEMSTGWVPSIKVRLFQNQKGVHFVFPVHEQVDPVLSDMGIPLVESPIPVHHYGKLDQARTVERWQTYYDIGHKKLASQPDNDHALKELAIQAALLSKWEEAATHWKSFVERNPDYVDGYLNLTRVMANCGDYEQANRYADKAYQLAGDRSATIYNLALSELQTGRATKAAQTANRMVATFPDDPDGKLLHALAEICAGKIDEGTKLLLKLSEIVPIVSLLPRIRSILGSIKSAGFDEWLVSLKAELSKVINLNETVAQPVTSTAKKVGVINKTTVGVDENTSTLLEKAVRYYERENYQAALDSLLQIVAAEPDHWEAYEVLVDLVQQSGQDIDILNHLRPLENRPNLPAKILALIGHEYEASGDLERATDFVAQAITIDRECARAWNLKGVIAYRNGHASEATQFFQKASECDVNWGDPWTNMGTLHWDQGAQDKALDCFKTGFQLSPTGPNVATTYHIAISETGQYERARKVFEDIVPRHPDFRKGYFLLIDVLIQLEDYPAALNQIETVIVHFGVDSQMLDAAKAVRAKVGPLTISKGKRPSLSLCMIVKNEEQYLPRCLASLKPIVDEMIVVDTGSTDTTQDIAEVFGAKVFDFEWNGDFSDARNHSLEKASGDWILVMDADEIIAAKDHKKFRKLFATKKYHQCAFMIETRNYTDRYNLIGWEQNILEYPDAEAGTGWIPSKKVRLFPNNMNIRFEYPVHEVVGPSLERLNFPVVSCPYPVHHYGKLDPKKEVEKDFHYYTLGMKKLELVKDDPAPIREMAIQAHKLGKTEESIALWKQYIKLKPKDANSYVNISTSYAKLRQYTDAKKAAQKAIKLSPNLKTGLLNLGLSELLLGNVEKAETIFHRIAKKHHDYFSAIFLLASSQLCQEKTNDAAKTLRPLKDSIVWNKISYAILNLVESLSEAGWIELTRNLIAGSIALECSNRKIMEYHYRLKKEAA